MQPIDDCNHGISSPKLGHFFGKGQGRPSAFSPLVTRLAWSAFFTNMERKKYHQEGFRVQGANGQLKFSISILLSILPLKQMVQGELF